MSGHDANPKNIIKGLPLKLARLYSLPSLPNKSKSPPMLTLSLFSNVKIVEQ